MPSLPDRPAVLTVEMQAEIVRLLGEGNYLETACLAAGTNHQTFNYWRRLCESGSEHAQKYADFFAAVKKATALAEGNALRSVRGGGFGWQGDAWFLERRFRKRWGRAEKSDKAQGGGEDELTKAHERLRDRKTRRPGKPPG